MLQLLRIRDLKEIRLEVEKTSLKKNLGIMDLLLLGIGGIIGTGIFLLSGLAAEKYAGPAITLSFCLGGIACVFIAMAYAELASMLPVAGSSYTFAYLTLGELAAAINGWLVLMFYTFGSATVASSWSGYLVGILESAGVHLPSLFTKTPYEGGWVNLPAVFIALVISLFLIRGNKEASKINGILVAVKLGAIFLFIFLAIPHINLENWAVFAPHGFLGIAAGAGSAFMAYTGFETLASAAEECKNPNRDLPLGIIGSIVVCAILYVIVAGILTAIIPYTQLKNAEPMAFALRANGIQFGSKLVATGAIAAMTSVIFAQIYGQSRILFVMARDGMMPPCFNRVHTRFSTPYIGILITGLIIILITGFTPVAPLSEITSMSVLAAFSLVSLSVIIMRIKYPHEKRPFRCPAVYLTSTISVGISLFLLAQLFPSNWKPFLLSILIGICFYLSYGYRNSKMSQKHKEKKNGADSFTPR